MIGVQMSMQAAGVCVLLHNRPCPSPAVPSTSTNPARGYHSLAIHMPCIRGQRRAFLATRPPGLALLVGVRLAISNQEIYQILGCPLNRRARQPMSKCRRARVPLDKWYRNSSRLLRPGPSTYTECFLAVARSSAIAQSALAKSRPSAANRHS